MDWSREIEIMRERYQEGDIKRKRLIGIEINFEIDIKIDIDIEIDIDIDIEIEIEREI